MTNEEALERIRDFLIYYESLDADDEEEKDIEALKLAIQALEKQIPNKPLTAYQNKDYLKQCGGYGLWAGGRFCPTCKKELYDSETPASRRHSVFLSVCKCGQKLDWSEVK